MTTAAPEQRIKAESDREKQLRQAEEMLFEGPARSGFAKALFKGDFRSEILFPYPELNEQRRNDLNKAIESLRAFADEHIDAAAIDREADIPRSVIDGLGALGVLGMTAPPEYGGRGFSQMQYCRIMELIGGHCAATGVFVNAHHSIGIRALILFGTDEQKNRWLPALVRGEQLAAFALTETEAGSDAANVQTVATPSADGQSYVLNGDKRYITNGAIAGVLTVMARTPDPKGGESKVTAFLVTPDMPGFEVVEARMPKCGIRGTATARLAFHDMRVPASNILGPLGKGLRVALTVLDFGRTTFGASCTGAAKICLRAAVKHVNRRKQFGRPLADLELVKKKIARMGAFAYAMEATTYQTAALIDSGAEDYMLETAILKVFSTEALWEIVYETLQVHGGQGYFNDEPFERMMRDARINQIGEGANEVLKAFIALVGLREQGEHLKETLDRLKSPVKAIPTAMKFGWDHVGKFFVRPKVALTSRNGALDDLAAQLATRVKQLGWSVEHTLTRWAGKYDLVKHPENIVQPQYDQERLAIMAIALHTSACTLSRLDHEIATGKLTEADNGAARLYLQIAFDRFDRAKRALGRNVDPLVTSTADALLKGP